MPTGETWQSAIGKKTNESIVLGGRRGTVKKQMHQIHGLKFAFRRAELKRIANSVMVET